MEGLTLVSHELCPYVQRAAIAMTEKGMDFDRKVVDLTNKPKWFLDISPLGKTPVLVSKGTAIFESAVILEYLEDTGPLPLHPADPLQRAEHRAWIEFGSAILNDIAGFYNATNSQAFNAKRDALAAKFQRVEQRLRAVPFFAGEKFSIVDAVYAPIFRYFDVFDQITDFGILDGLDNCTSWRQTLSTRPSVIAAVGPDYSDRLRRFLTERKSHIARVMSSESHKELETV